GGGRLITTADDVFDVVAQYGLPTGRPRPLILTSGPETSLVGLSRELSKELAVIAVVEGIIDHGVRDYDVARDWVGRYLSIAEENHLGGSAFDADDCVNAGI